jgi:hypothetical protein
MNENMNRIMGNEFSPKLIYKGTAFLKKYAIFEDIR